MELKVSPEKPGFSSSDSEEKEISEGEDEDDDRNHKHRRKDAQSSLHNHLTTPYRKRNRPHENGYDSTTRNYNIASDRDFSYSRFDRRRFNQASFSKAPSTLNQRIREPISWGFHDSRFGMVDVASQIIQPGPVPSAMFAHNTSWNTFGLLPGLPNGGLQGPLIPAISPPINIALQRQRCRDFEERGFCLRGDMCPMEHGLNRIVIEDVQSLSQFNLPVSQIPVTSSAQGALPVSSKNVHLKSCKPGMTEDAFVGGASTSDVYDPDQPLWSNDHPQTSAAQVVLNQSNGDGTESLLDVNLPNQQSIESVEGLNDDRMLRNATAAASQSSSVWGRMGSSKSGVRVKEKIDLAGTSNVNLLNVPNQGKRMIVNGNGSYGKELLVKKQHDFVQNPAQKALRTLFVNYIPLKDNKKEVLLSHFQKFGEVVDIYIPIKTERAFVQFSKREEAEAALQAPDAVMGNRFIKLWWANRDNIPVDGISSSTVPVTPNQFILNEGKENPHPVTDIDSSNSHAEKAVLTNGCEASPPLQQKKLENLEILKEELRKKQEMLDQKRNEFRRQLEKLGKQAVVSKDMPASAKMMKDETAPDLATERTMTHTSSSHQSMPVHEPSRPFHQLAPFVAKRFKLDNRPTAFRVVPPLPDGLGDVSVLEEHFSSYGDLASVVLEVSEANNASVSARVSYTTRQSAERAFLRGKSWQGHKLQFLWINAGKQMGCSGNLPAASNDVDASTDNKKTADEPGNQEIEADTHSKSTSSSEGDLLVVQ